MGSIKKGERMKNFMLNMTAIAVMTMIGFVGQAVAEVTVVSWGGAYTEPAKGLC